MRIKNNHQAGFTLLELLVVMVIIGLLVGYVGPKYFEVGKSEAKTAKAQIVGLSKALDMYRLDTGHYPSQEAGLEALNTQPANEPSWQGPYMQKNIPLDPWGKPYQYKIPGEKSEYDLYSLGKDNKLGGDGINQDIYN